MVSIMHASFVKLNKEELTSILFLERMEIQSFVEACESKYHPEVILITAAENRSYAYFFDFWLQMNGIIKNILANHS